MYGSAASLCKLDDRIDLQVMFDAKEWLERAISLTQRQVESPKELAAVRTLIVLDLRRTVEVLETVLDCMKRASSSDCSLATSDPTCSV